jgi:hypothetical protein
MNAGGSNATIDDFNTNWAFDRAPHDFLGGFNVSGGFNTALPIGYRPVPSGTPQWGIAWKQATAKWYQTAMTINASGSVMANRYNCFDLDPTYRNAFGQPLMRMTFDYKDNEHKMGVHAAQVINDIAKSMNPTRLNSATARTDPWTVVPYQSTALPAPTAMPRVAKPVFRIAPPATSSRPAPTMSGRACMASLSAEPARSRISGIRLPSSAAASSGRRRRSTNSSPIRKLWCPAIACPMPAWPMPVTAPI